MTLSDTVRVSGIARVTMSGFLTLSGTLWHLPGILAHSPVPQDPRMPLLGFLTHFSDTSEIPVAHTSHLASFEPSGISLDPLVPLRTIWHHSEPTGILPGAFGTSLDPLVPHPDPLTPHPDPWHLTRTSRHLTGSTYTPRTYWHLPRTPWHFADQPKSFGIAPELSRTLV